MKRFFAIVALLALALPASAAFDLGQLMNNLARHQGGTAKFVEKNPDGAIHHICYEVDDILVARDQLKAKGARVLGDGNPRIGAHGKPVLFLHPKDFCGTLVELEQA